MRSRHLPFQCLSLDGCFELIHLHLRSGMAALHFEIQPISNSANLIAFIYVTNNFNLSLLYQIVPNSIYSFFNALISANWHASLNKTQRVGLNPHFPGPSPPRSYYSGFPAAIFQLRVFFFFKESYFVIQ